MQQPTRKVLTVGPISLAILLLASSALGGAAALYLTQQWSQTSERSADLSERFDNAVSPSDLVKMTAPAVVNIAVLQPSPALQNPLLRDPFFRQYLGVPDAALQPTIAAGSGVVVDAQRGLVVTNFHVIRGATAIEIGLQDNRHFRAEVVGAAPELDLAILRVSAARLPALKFGNSSQVAVGDEVLAIGNPFGLGQTVTAGIVSATERGLDADDSRRFIQTDAAINPGNSGGPLLNARGEIIGINSAIISPSRGSVGIGFAIPSNVVARIVAQVPK
jgi:S1-C subfamily serine protease